MDRVRVMKSVHNTIMVVVADNIPNELRLVLGALDVWAYNPNGRRDSQMGYSYYEVDKSLKNYFKDESFKAMLLRFNIKPNEIKISL